MPEKLKIAIQYYGNAISKFPNLNFWIFSFSLKKKVHRIKRKCRSDLIRSWTVTRDRSGRPFCLCGFMVLTLRTTDGRRGGSFVCVMRNGDRLVASRFAHHMASARQRITVSVPRRPQTRCLFCVGFLFSICPSLPLFFRADWKKSEELENELSVAWYFAFNYRIFAPQLPSAGTWISNFSLTRVSVSCVSTFILI